MLRVVLQGCETSSLLLREEGRLMILNRILKRIFGSNRVNNGKWRRLHNEELHSLYRSHSILKLIKIGKSFIQNGRR